MEKYSNHSKNQGGKSNRYRVIRNSSVICHRQPRLPLTQVTPISMRELWLRPALRFVDYLAFFFSGATTLCFGSPREMNFCETTRHHWKNPRLYVLTRVQQLNSWGTGGESNHVHVSWVRPVSLMHEVENQILFFRTAQQFSSRRA